MFPLKATEIQCDKVFKHLVSDGCIRNAPGLVFSVPTHGRRLQCSYLFV